MSGIDPVKERSCFKVCVSCYKCESYRSSSLCASCPGRPDPERRRYPDPDSYCDCKNGILRHRLRNGRLVIRKFLSDPFGGKVTTDAETEDERDWNAFVWEKREMLDDPNWDPIKFYDGTSTFDATKNARGNRGA